MDPLSRWERRVFVIGLASPRTRPRFRTNPRSLVGSTFLGRAYLFQRSSTLVELSRSVGVCVRCDRVPGCDSASPWEDLALRPFGKMMKHLNSEWELTEGAFGAVKDVSEVDRVTSTPWSRVT